MKPTCSKTSGAAAVASRAFPWESSGRSYSRSMPAVFSTASGSTLTDEHGRQFLDMLSGAGVAALGHHDPDVEDAVARASSAPTSHLDMRTVWEERFAEALLPHLPFADKDRVKLHFCGPSGSDAVEAAIKIARIATGRDTIVAFTGAYHGMSQGALSVTSKVDIRERGLWTAQPVAFAPYPYPYRAAAPFDTPEAAADYCMAYLHTMLEDDHSGVGRPAALIVEPIQGEGGCIVPTPGFLRRVRELCRHHGVLVIADEIQTGVGRTGRWFASEAEGLEPDIVCISKAAGGGYPLSLIAFDEALNVFRPGEHIGTFRGQATALAAGWATLCTIQKRNLVVEAAAKGVHLSARLKRLQAKHPELIGEVRGRGLMLGVEMKGPDAGRKAELVQQRLLERRVIVERGGRNGSVVRLLPALNIPWRSCDAFIKKLDDVLEAMAAQPRSTGS